MKLSASKEIQFLYKPKWIIKEGLLNTISKKEIFLKTAKISFIIGVLVSISSMQYFDFWVLVDGAICWSFLPLLIIALSYFINKILYSSNLSTNKICYLGLIGFSPWVLFLLLIVIVVFIMQILYPNIPNPINTKNSFISYGYLITSSIVIYYRFLIHQQIHKSIKKALVVTLLFEGLLLSFIIGFFYFSDQLMPRIIDGIK